MWFTGKLRYDQRGAGSIIGAVFIFLILFSGYMFYALQVNVENEYNETLQDMQQLDLKRNRENVEFITVRFDDGKLNITVRNIGSYQAHLIWLGIFDGTVTPSTQEYYEIDFYVNPAETVTNVGDDAIPSFEGQERTIELVTGLGNTFSCFYPLREEEEAEYDFVDSQGGPPAIGTHSFFSAMQSGPDGVMDTLTEGIGVSKEDYVDVFPSGNGTHSNQTAQQDGPNGVYDTLTEAASPAIQYYYPSGYNLVGSTTYDSGSLDDLTSNNSMYMTFNSYPSATSALTLYAHQETTTIGGTTYYLQKLDSADAAGTSLSASMAATGRQLFGKFVYPLTGMSSIPASTWTIYYRGWQDTTPSIAFDAASSGSNGGGSTSVSWSHTTGSGWNRNMIVGVSIRTTTVSVSSITYGAQSLTFLRADTHPSATIRSELWYLIAPTSGTATVTVTLSGTSKATGGSCTYTGVAQTSPLDANGGGTGTSNSPSRSVTVNTANSWLLGHLAVSGSIRTVSSEGSGQTLRWDQVTTGGSAASRNRGHGSDKGPVGTGSQTMSWTLSGSADWAASVVAFKPASPPVGHADIDILIRQSDGTIRATIATNVADSGDLTTTPTTLSGTYSFADYTVFDQTDYLEIDYYVEVTAALSGISAYLRIDDDALAIADQTRATNIVQPDEYTVEVEFTGSSDIQSWNQIVWTVDSQFTAPNVTTTLQLWNYYTGSYSTSGDGYQSYTSSSIQGTDETRTQTITSNPTYFRDSSGNWKLKIKGAKTTNSQFSWKGDFIEYQDQYPVYQLNLEEQFTDCDYSQTNADLCIYTRALSSESLMVDVWSESASAWITVISSLQPNTWNNVTVASYLTGPTLRIRFWTGTDTGDTTQDSWQIDSTLLRVWSPNYRLDLEVQWTNADSGETYEWLCIHGGNMSSEDLRVDVWNGTSWVTIIAKLESGWNSVDVSSYLVSSTFKIRFRDDVGTGDAVQDSWEIDATFLHVWS